MLDALTKRRIDTARDILVGKLPDPKSQVEQITIALIYKFMDDMDKQSEELGGKTKFFTGEYEKYSWSKIFDPRVSGYELVGLYGEAIQQMNHNPNIPQLFRNIFKNAYLPYRDSETLKMFLKVIGEFEYDYSEKLGDAFEYLLSIMGSQGDAGQFRTPRHIIDFMVKVVDPSKNETILDPACGTAGFLISSFNHIQNKNKKDGRINLTPDERTRLIENLSGYDISPDMVRLSLVNMYLHGFQSPKIYEYDTLASEEKWNEFYDIILANPPFMSPKGGIKPHKRFSVQAKRSEVLFVDYIAEHLNPNGRGGVIVPEGIVFKSETAYKKLRKMLIENSLYAVVSLPAGVFNPYAGVKTSILFLNKNLAKKTGKILFVKINNDGFGLGAQRREIKENDLPMALEIINKYKQSVIENKEIEFNLAEAKMAHVVKKEKIAESGDYNLNGDRYKEAIVYNGKWNIVELKKIAEVIAGQSPKGEYYNKKGDGVPFYQGKKEFTEMYISEPKNWTSRTTKIAKKGDILMSVRAPVGPVNFSTQKICIGRGLSAIIPNERIEPLFLFYCLRSIEEKIQGNGGSVFDSINTQQIKKIKIPLPPLEIQQQIVSELDSYQKIINGARQVVENYKPTFKIDHSWPLIELKDSELEIVDGDRGINYPTHQEFTETGYCVFLNTKNVLKNGFNFDTVMFIKKEKDSLLRKGKLKRNDIILTTRGTIGNVAINDLKTPYEHIRINSGMLIFRPNIRYFLPKYIFYLFQTEYIQNKFKKMSTGSAQPQLPIRNLKFIKIPVPNLEKQQYIVKKIESEQKAINSNKELITIFEKKIKDKIAEVWGE